MPYTSCDVHVIYEGNVPKIFFKNINRWRICVGNKQPAIFVAYGLDEYSDDDTGSMFVCNINTTQRFSAHHYQTELRRVVGVGGRQSQ